LASASASGLEWELASEWVSESELESEPGWVWVWELGWESESELGWESALGSEWALQ
jgi:hypothetical protein